MSNCSNIYANSALQCDYISFPLLKRNSPRLYRFKKMLKENSLRRNDLNNTTGVKEASTKSKPSILKETRKMSTFPWLNHGSLIQSRSVWTEACAGAEGSARDIAQDSVLHAQHATVSCEVQVCAQGGRDGRVIRTCDRKDVVELRPTRLSAGVR